MVAIPTTAATATQPASAQAASRLPEFVPTPDEIRKACAEIRAEWSPREFVRRSRLLEPYERLEHYLRYQPKVHKHPTFGRGAER